MYYYYYYYCYSSCVLPRGKEARIPQGLQQLSACERARLKNAIIYYILIYGNVNDSKTHCKRCLKVDAVGGA